MEQRKETAVDWIVEQLTPSIALQQKYIDEIKEQAKEIERKQIIDAATWGYNSRSGEHYYYQNYGKE